MSGIMKKYGVRNFLKSGICPDMKNSGQISDRKTGQILDTKNPGHILDNLWTKKTGQILVVRRKKIPGKFWTIKNQKM